MTHPRRNIELKARYPDLSHALSVVKKLGARPDRSMAQVDTYFHSSNGRLKLREITTAKGSSAELIAYQRSDSTEFRDSQYFVVPAPDPALLKAALTAACGLRGVVRKHRDVYLFHNVRIHLDQVDGLGSFIEFEAVMAEGEPDATSLTRLDQLHAALGIKESDHERGSYSDLLGI
jgi:adenylate cyclase, class 2